MAKQGKNYEICCFFNHKDINFYPIFKNLVSKCLTEHLLLKKKFKDF